MVCFQTNLGKFWRVFERLVYSMATWYILRAFGNSVYFLPFWYIVSRKIWQPCYWILSLPLRRAVGKKLFPFPGRGKKFSIESISNLVCTYIGN
jgi:hypothetical protein